MTTSTCSNPHCELRTLNNLKPGECALIADLDHIHRTVCHRLQDLGITEGTRVHLKRRGLFGGPMMLEANGQLFGLRLHEAELIGVVMG